MLSLNRILARLTSQSVIAKAELNHSKKLFELGGLLLASEPNLDSSEFQNLLSKREMLGSTALGDGVAIPHAVSQKINHPVLAVITLKAGIAFDAPDHKLVDIFICMMLPEQSQTENEDTLKKIAKMAQNEPLKKAIRNSQTSPELYQALLMATVLEL